MKCVLYTLISDKKTHITSGVKAKTRKRGEETYKQGRKAEKAEKRIE